jgi:hypothetical protein
MKENTKGVAWAVPTALLVALLVPGNLEDQNVPIDPPFPPAPLDKTE